MSNISKVTSFYLSEFGGMEGLKPLYFCIFLLIYLSIIAENAVLVGVICREKTLREPMHRLLCHLSLNGLYGGTALLPAVLVTVLSRSYEISVPLCQTQVYAIHTYAIIEFTILAVMSYDRYVAICQPLSYHTVMSQRLDKLVAFMWLYPLLAFLLLLGLTVHLPYCSRTIEKVYCMNYLLVRLSCTDTTLVNAIGLLSVVLYTGPQLAMIFFSYAHILKICIKSLSNSKFKALRTCTPHLLSIVNYSIGCFFEIAQGRLDSSHMSYQTKLFMSLYFLIFPALLNPIIYGLSIQLIRLRLLGLVSRNNRRVETM